MRDFFYYAKSVATRHSSFNWMLIMAMMLIEPAIYAVGLADQPELYSYVEDGNFYGTYIYDLFSVRLVSFCVAMAVVVFWSSVAFRDFFAPRRATLSIMLPTTLGAKFTYAALFNLVLVPSVMIGLWFVNNWLWSYFLQIEDGEIGLYMILNIVGLLMVVNSLFFFFGVLFRRYQWAYCAGFTLVLSAVLYVYGAFNSSVSGAIDFASIPVCLALILELIVTTLLVILSWVRFRRL